MSKTATYSTLNPLVYAPGLPITTQNMKALNQMASWLIGRVTETYVGIYTIPTLDGTLEGLGYAPIAASPTTWRSVGYFSVFIKAEFTSRITASYIGHLTSAGAAAGGRGGVNIKINSTDNIFGFGTSNDTWLTSTGLSGALAGPNTIEILVRYDYNSTGAGTNYYLEYLSGLTVHADLLTGSYPDVL